MTKANSLTRQIIAYIIYSGGHAERVNNIARQIEGRFVRSSATRGTADIHAIKDGKAVMIEVKIGKDRQSQAQKDYQNSVERANGIYFIAADFDEFLVKWNQI